MKRASTITFLILYITGCIHRPGSPTQPKECANIRTPNNLHLKVKTRIEVPDNKVILIQHIFIKDGKIRIDTMGAFDDILTSILFKDKNIFLIHFQQKSIYTFTDEEEFYRMSGIYLPIFDLPVLLTLSDEYNSKKRELTFIKDENSCRINRIDIISPLSGNIEAYYYDFSPINGDPIFHRLTIKNKKQKIEVNIKVLKAVQEEIKEEIFNTNITGFDYVKK